MEVKLLQELETFASNVETVLSMPEIKWQWRPAGSDWSLSEVMCHLRDVELEVHQVRYKAVLAGDNPFIPGASTDEWAVIRCYRQQDGPDARDAFLLARRNTISMLEEMQQSSWQRKARHSFLGPTDLQELVGLAAQHDQVHWQQIQDLLRTGRNGP